MVLDPTDLIGGTVVQLVLVLGAATTTLYLFGRVILRKRRKAEFDRVARNRIEIEAIADRLIERHAEALSWHSVDIDMFIDNTVKSALSEEQLSCWSEYVTENIYVKTKVRVDALAIERDNQSAREEESRIVSNIVRNISNIIDRHLDVLARKKLTLIVKDDYGLIRKNAWIPEIEYFISNVIMPALKSQEQARWSEKWNRFVSESIDRKVDAHAESRFQNFQIDMDPWAFEQHCKAVLVRLGWHAETTKATGDQGADIVANRNGRRIVIQCKKYTGAIGNDAVQQVQAARGYYGAHDAFVVSNSSFTKSAQQLAAVLDVKLLQHSDMTRTFADKVVPKHDGAAGL